MGNSNHGTAIDGTVSGTSISFGSETVFEAASTDGIDVVYDTSNDKTVVLFRDVDDSNKGKALTYVGGSNQHHLRKLHRLLFQMVHLQPLRVQQ